MKNLGSYAIWMLALFVASSYQYCTKKSDCKRMENAICYKYSSCIGRCGCDERYDYQDLTAIKCVKYVKVLEKGDRCGSRNVTCKAPYDCGFCPENTTYKTCREKSYVNIIGEVCDSNADCKARNLTCIKPDKCKKGYCGCTPFKEYKGKYGCAPIDKLLDRHDKCVESEKDKPCGKDLNCMRCDKAGVTFHCLHDDDSFGDDNGGNSAIKQNGILFAVIASFIVVVVAQIM